MLYCRFAAVSYRNGLIGLRTHDAPAGWGLGFAKWLCACLHPRLLYLQVCDATLRRRLFHSWPVTASLCILTVCHLAHYCHPHSPQSPVAMSPSTGSKSFPCRCRSLEIPWWSNMSTQHESSLWAPAVLKDIIFFMVSFPFAPTFWLVRLVWGKAMGGGREAPDMDSSQMAAGVSIALKWEPVKQRLRTFQSVWDIWQR